MAAITPTKAKYTVAGSVKQQLYTISGSSGDTLIVGMNTINAITGLGGLITSYAVASATPGAGQSTITFTSSGPFTTQQICVIGN